LDNIIFETKYQTHSGIKDKYTTEFSIDIMAMNWKGFEFVFFLCIMFGLLISLSNVSNFSNFPYNMTLITWIGLILFIGGLYGIYKAES